MANLNHREKGAEDIPIPLHFSHFQETWFSQVSWIPGTWKASVLHTDCLAEVTYSLLR